MCPREVKATYLTRKELIENIKKQEEETLVKIKEGIILWGRKFLVRMIEEGRS